MKGEKVYFGLLFQRFQYIVYQRKRAQQRTVQLIEAGRQTEKREETRVPVSPQGFAPSDLFSFHWASPPKGFTFFQECHGLQTKHVGVCGGQSRFNLSYTNLTEILYFLVLDEFLKYSYSDSY